MWRRTRCRTAPTSPIRTYAGCGTRRCTCSKRMRQQQGSDAAMSSTALALEALTTAALARVAVGTPDALAEAAALMDAAEDADALEAVAVRLAAEDSDPWQPYRGPHGGAGWKH